MKKILALFLFCMFGSANAVQPVPYIFASMPAGNVVASTLDADFAYLNNANKLSVLFSGAKCDGITDDYAAISALLTYANSLVDAYGWGQEVDMNGCIAAIGTTLTIPAGVHFKGPGLIKPLSGVTTMIAASNLRERISELGIVVPNNGIGINATNCHYCKLDHNFIYANSNPASGITGILLGTITGAEGSWLTDVLDNTMDFNQTSTATGIKGISLVGPQNRINIERNTLAGFQGIGINVAGGAGGTFPQMINILGNDIESMGLNAGSPASYAINTEYCYSINIRGNYLEQINGSASYMLNIGGTLSGIGSYQSRMVTIEDNYSATSTEAGFIYLNHVTAPNVGQNFYPGTSAQYMDVYTANTLFSESGTFPSPRRLYSVVAIPDAAASTPGVSYVVSQNAIPVSSISLNQNVYFFSINFNANAADTYTFQLREYFGGAIIATASVTTGGAGVATASTVFRGTVGNPYLYEKTGIGTSTIQIYAASIASN